MERELRKLAFPLVPTLSFLEFLANMEVVW